MKQKKMAFAKAIVKMAMDLVQPPSIPPYVKGIPEPSFVDSLAKSYRDILGRYINLERLAGELSMVCELMKDSYVASVEYTFGDPEPPQVPLPFTVEQLKASAAQGSGKKSSEWPQKGKPRGWNSHSHGKELYEPPHGDRQKGFRWHEAHNTALFLQLVVTLTRFLLDGRKPDLGNFHKKMLLLKKRLDVQGKAKTNARRQKTRGSYKTHDVKFVVQKEVERLLKTIPWKKLRDVQR